MAAGVMACGVQDPASGGDFAVGDSQFKLSAFAVDIVSGVSGMGTEIFPGRGVSGMDLVQPAFRGMDKVRHTLFYNGGSGKQFSAAALRRIVF